MLKAGIGWNQLSQDLLGVSDARCGRRMRTWTEVGVRPAVHEMRLADLRAAGALDLDQCAVDGSHVRALKGGHVGLSPIDQGQPDSKHHLIVATHGIPLQVTLFGGSRNDITPTASPGGLDPTNPWAAWPAPAQALRVVRRSWLRPRQAPAPGACSRDHSSDCPLRSRPRFRTGPAPLDGGTRLRTAALLQAATHSMGTPSRPTPSAAIAGLRADLPSTAHRIVKRVLMAEPLPPPYHRLQIRDMPGPSFTYNLLSSVLQYFREFIKVGESRLTIK